MSGTNLIEAIAAERTRERAPDKWRRYADLLEKGQCTAGEVAEMKVLARGLGRTLDDIHRDEAALQRMRQLEQLISGGAGCEPEFQKAYSAAEAFKEEMAAAIASLKEKYRVLLAKVEDWRAAQNNGIEACAGVQNLRRANPHLLAHLVPPDANTLILTPWEGFRGDEPAATAAKNTERLKV